MERKYNNVDIKQLDDNLNYFVNYSVQPNEESGIKENNKLLFKCLNDKYKIKILNHDSGIALASAISSYARIQLTHFMRLYKTCYFDTDSFVTNDIIKKDLITDKIGGIKNVLSSSFNDYIIEKDKLCYFEEGIFLAPKSYILKLPANCKQKYIAHLKGVTLNNINLEDL